MITTGRHRIFAAIMISTNQSRLPDRYITVSKGISGFFACEIRNEEIYQTGIGRWPERKQAMDEAKEWAESEGIKYIE